MNFRKDALKMLDEMSGIVSEESVVNDNTISFVVDSILEDLDNEISKEKIEELKENESIIEDFRPRFLGKLNESPNPQEYPNGTMYKDTRTGTVYIVENGLWESLVEDGKQGAQGRQGVAGSGTGVKEVETIVNSVISLNDTVYDSYVSLSAIPVSDRVVNKVYKIKHSEVKTPIEVMWDGSNFKGFRENVLCNENRYDTYAIPFASATTTFTQIYTNINNGLGYFTLPAGLIGYTSASPFTKLRIKWFHNLSNASTSALEFSTRIYANGFATSAYFPFSFPETPISAGLASRYGYSEFFIDHNTNLTGDQNVRQTWRHSFGVYNYFADDNNSMIYDIFTTATPNLDYTVDNIFRFYTRIKNPAAQMSYGCRGLEISILP